LSPSKSGKAGWAMACLSLWILSKMERVSKRIIRRKPGFVQSEPGLPSRFQAVESLVRFNQKS
jgi:hypothetical protein